MRHTRCRVIHGVKRSKNVIFRVKMEGMGVEKTEWLLYIMLDVGGIIVPVGKWWCRLIGKAVSFHPTPEVVGLFLEQEE